MAADAFTRTGASDDVSSTLVVNDLVIASDPTCVNSAPVCIGCLTWRRRVEPDTFTLHLLRRTGRIVRDQKDGRMALSHEFPISSTSRD